MASKVERKAAKVKKSREIWLIFFWKIFDHEKILAKNSSLYWKGVGK